MALLEVGELRASYGQTRVLHGISFAIEEGTITALLGANGAGKTTTLRALCAMVKTSGSVKFSGERIEELHSRSEDHRTVTPATQPGVAGARDTHVEHASLLLGGRWVYNKYGYSASFHDNGFGALVGLRLGMIRIDGTYDMVAVQEVQKYGRKSGCDFGPVDPVKYAEAFGATGLMIRTADEIIPVLSKAFDTPGPVIVVFWAIFSSPWLVKLPKPSPELSRMMLPLIPVAEVSKTMVLPA